MKKIARIIRRILYLLGSVLLLIALFLLFTGIPKPSAITTLNVPRLPVKYAFQMFDNLKSRPEITQFSMWHPDQKSARMYVWANSAGEAKKIHLLSYPGGRLIKKELKKLPIQAVGMRYNPNPQKDYLVYNLDKNGDEQFQLHRFDTKLNLSVQISDGKGRYGTVIFDKNGNRCAYNSNKRNLKDYDIYVMDPENPSSEKMVLAEEGSWYPGEWSPGGDMLIVTKRVSVNESYPYVLQVDSPVKKQIGFTGNEKVKYNGLKWNKKGSRIYYVCDHQSDFKRLHFYDLKMEKDSLLVRDVNWDVVKFEISPDEKWLAFKTIENALGKLYMMDLESGEFKPIGELPPGSVGQFRFHAMENQLAFNHKSPSGITNIYVYDFENGLLTNWTPDNSYENPFPMPEIIHYPTFDVNKKTGQKREIAAFLHRPITKTDKPFPVVIYIHGGPESRVGIVRGPIVEMFLQKGIAVLAPNIRGSTGYGKEFVMLDNGILRENAVKDIGALLDWIGEHPELDKNKVAVYGASYGGYMSMACAVKYGDRLKCAINLFGISSFVSFLENTNEDRRDLRREEYGDERNPEIRAFMEEISPLSNVEKINIPLLIYQGKNDPRVPYTESRQMVEKINNRKGTVWYIEAGNEGHGITKPKNQFYTGAVGFKFVDQFLLD